MRAALSFPGTHYIAAVADDQARKVGAMNRADSVACIGKRSQRNPAADADPERRMRIGRNVLGCISLMTFFAQALRRRSGANSEAGREAA
jgi:hypothetical protein